ncbi:hypothetical protein GCM10023263_55910 [Phytohabitans rumicis]
MVLTVWITVVVAPTVVAAAFGHASIGVVMSFVIVLAWLGLVVRAVLRARNWRAIASRGAGPPLPPGAGVREPRRPKPNPVGGAAALPWPDTAPR